jgi:glycine cleavage system H protein
VFILADNDFLVHRQDKFIFRVKTGVLYTWNDTWARVEGEIATIGVTDYMQKHGGDVVSVEMPPVGKKVEQFDEIMLMETVKAAIPVLSPFSGEIVEVNSSLPDSPELVNTNPYDKGWIMKIKIADIDEKKNLEVAEKYFEIMKGKIEKDVVGKKE